MCALLRICTHARARSVPEQRAGRGVPFAALLIGMLLILGGAFAGPASATPIVAAKDSLDYGSELDVQSYPGGAFQFNAANCAVTPCYGDLCLSSSTPCAGTIYLRDSLAKIKVKDTTCNEMVTGHCYNKGTPSGPGHNARFFTCARGYYTSTNVTAWKCSDGSYIDNQPPYPPSYLYDSTGSDIDYQTGTTSLSMNMAAISDNGYAGVSGYRYCFTTSTAPGSPPYTCSGSVYNGTGTCTAGSVNGYCQNSTNPVTASSLTLTGGTTYYSCVSTMDKVYNKGVWRCSDGVRIDTDTPLPPGAAYDGSSGDIDWQSSTTSLSGNWTAGSDSHSGVQNYNYCFSTGSGCTGTIVASGDTASLSVGRTSLTLTAGTTYYTCVRTRDRAGRLSGYRCSDGVTVDTTGPAAPSAVRDGTGADIDWQPSVTSISANWNAATSSGAGVASYRHCVSTATPCAGTVVAGWISATSTGITRSVSLAAGTRYYSCVYAVDAAGNNSATACSDGVVPDTAAPGAPPAVRDGSGADIAWTNSGTTLAANWDAATDSASGIGSYQYCMSTAATCTGTVVAGWTSVASTTLSASRGALTLAHGQIYITCVRAVDVAGNLGSARCSNGQTVDVLVGAPASAQDGTGADVEWQSSTTSISANWPSVSDSPSGVLRYETCFSTAITCGGIVVSGWQSAGNSLAATRPVVLVDGTKYYGCVRTVDNAGNVSGATCSNGVVVDAVPPSQPAAVRDGTGADIMWNTTSTTLAANWDTASDAGSGVSRHEYCIATSGDCSTGMVVGWTTETGTSFSRTGLGLLEGTTYYVCVRGVDGAGNVGAAGCSDGQTVDLQVAATAAVRDGSGADIATQGSTTTLRANWDAVTDSPSGLDSYETCFSTASSCSGTIVSGWTTAGATTSTSRSGLALVDGTTYYACVRARDRAGNVSGIACSDGVLVEAVPVSVSSLSPASAPQGRRGAVSQVAGSAFQAGATVAVSGTGVTVVRVTFLSSTSVEVELDIAGSATVGARDVTVTNPDDTSGTATGVFTVTAASVTVGLTTIGYADTAASSAAPWAVDFGQIFAGSARSIGPSDSGQATPGAAVTLEVTSDTDVVVQASSTDWVAGPHVVPASALAWARAGSGAWTSFGTSAATVDGPFAPGSRSVAFDLRLSMPTAQPAGVYDATVTWSVVALP